MIVACSICACNEDKFLDITNENELVSETFYTNITNFNNALNSVYSGLKVLIFLARLFTYKPCCPYHIRLITGMLSAEMKLLLVMHGYTSHGEAGTALLHAPMTSWTTHLFSWLKKIRHRMRSMKLKVLKDKHIF